MSTPASQGLPANMNPGDEAPEGTPGTGQDICPDCGGQGKLASGEPCRNCGGTGRVVRGIGGA
jgi:RecJ-like exonuclease